MSGPFFDEIPGRTDIVGRVRDTRGRKINHPRGQDSPHAGLINRSGGAIQAKIAVGQGGGPGADHFSAGQEASPVNRLRVDKPGLRGEDVLFQPVLQGQVVGQTPEKGHGRMGVGIDQPRQDQEPPAVNHFPGRPELRTTGAEIRNPAVFDAYGAGRNRVGMSRGQG